jgi:hypothetical protein
MGSIHTYLQNYRFNGTGSLTKRAIPTYIFMYREPQWLTYKEEE